MVGVRIRHLPDQTLDKVLKIYFSKPEHGGGKIQRIYFPLMNNDAVIIFEDPKVVENITKFPHKMSGNDLEIEVLPEHMIFSTMEAKVDTNASIILQLSQKLRDEMEFGENIKITQNEDGTYSLKGNWFQLEWAWNYLNAYMKHQEVIQSQIQQTSNSQQSAAAMEIDDMHEDKWRTYRVRPASPSDVNSALRKNIADRAKSEELVRSPKPRRQPGIDRSLETNIPQDDRSRGLDDVFEGYEGKSPHDEVLMYQKSIGSPHESLRESPQSSFRQSPSSQKPSTSKARDTDTILAGLKDNINHSYGLSSLNRAGIYRDNPDNYDTDDELESLRGKEHIVPFESVHSSLGIGNQERKSDENKTFEQFSGMSLSHSRHKSFQESAGQNTDLLYSGGQSHSDTSLWRKNYYSTAGTGLDGARSMFGNKDDSLYGATALSTLDRSTETKVDKLKTGSASSRSQSDLPDRYTIEQLQSTFSIRNVSVTVCRGDLLQETTDCIVNPADNKLDHLGGVAYAIAQARGPEMGIECREYIRKNGSLAVSEVTHTSGGGKIKAQYIMHTVGPLWYGEHSKEKTANQLRETFLNCFVYGETKLEIKSLSTPAISTGVYSVALDLCVRCFLDAVLVFVDKNSVKSLTDIRLVSNDEESTVTAIVLLQTLLEAGIENLTAEAVESHNHFTNKSRMNLPRGRPETTDFSRSYLSSTRFDGTSDIPRGQHRRSMSASRVSDRRGTGGQTQKSSMLDKDTNSYVVDSGRLEDRARTKTRSSTESKSASAYGDKSYRHSGHSSKTVPQIKPNLLPSKSRLTTSKSSNLPASKTQTRPKTSAVRVGNERPRTSRLADSSYDDNYAHSYAGKLYTDDEGLDHDDGDFGLQSLPANFDKHSSSFREKFLQLNSEEKSNKKVNLCAICLDKVRNPKELSKCGHTFCAGCIDEYFHKDKPKCPTCGVIYGQIKGDQPKGGTMNCKTDRKLLIPGYEREDGTIIIQYTFPSGIQEACHPRPGRSYKGISRKAYLPNSVEGREILRLLKKAFQARLTFTIGESRTTGESGLITWNDIHHKTNIKGGPTNFGYPDSTYLKRVKEELADKGIVS